jgi:calcium-dependent protein kinase
MGCCVNKSSKNPDSSSRRKSLILSKNLVPLKKGNITDDYKIIQKLGDGGYGTVKLVTHKVSNSKRAVKIININQGIDISKMLDEVNILKSLDHPNIIKVYEVIQDSRALNIVMEYCSGGELFDKIKSTNGFSENIAAGYMLDIVSAIKYCHEVHIVHRDLKPENILLESIKPEARLKIIDFGTSQHFKPKEKMKKFIGTSYYIAPEVIDKNYDEKCDIWSLGVILYIMLCGLPPFYSRNDFELYEKIRKTPVSFAGKVWKNVSEEAKTLIEKMLKKNPIERISIAEVYLDPWIQNRAHNRVPDKPIAKAAMKSLSQFSVIFMQSQNFLQRITMFYIVSQLVSTEEIDELRKTFESLDKNGDGKLSKAELIEGYKNFYSEVDFDINELMAQCDADGNGYLEYTEFLAGAMNWHNVMSKQRLLSAFKLYDHDGNGKISSKELADTLSGIALDEKEFLDIMQKADANHDGEIDFEEFEELMKFNQGESNRI